MATRVGGVVKRQRPFFKLEGLSPTRNAHQQSGATCVGVEHVGKNAPNFAAPCGPCCVQGMVYTGVRATCRNGWASSIDKTTGSHPYYQRSINILTDIRNKPCPPANEPEPPKPLRVFLQSGLKDLVFVAGDQGWMQAGQKKPGLEIHC